MKPILLLLIATVLVAAGCGGDDETHTGAPQQRQDAPMTSHDAGGDPPKAPGADDASPNAPGADDASPNAPGADDASPNDRKSMPPTERDGVRLTVRDSEFGEMLFDSKRQAIYIFENDPQGETVCYGDCAEAWPPVVTDGDPVAGQGVRAGLLGTVERRDGTRQVTYAGRPLYYYAHEGPGEVRCHNVNLNGGFWWVVGPDGTRRA
jgi:predicted lipoprotein with Yx(FWY)xxD motif